MDRSGAGLAALIVVALGCTGCGLGDDAQYLAAGSTDQRAVLEAGESFQNEAVAYEAFGRVRALLVNPDGTVPSSTLQDLPGSRSFVCAYGEGVAPFPNICGTGTGESLAESLDDATRQLLRRAGSRVEAVDSWRLKIDVVRRVGQARFRRRSQRLDPAQVGRMGYWVRKDDEFSYLVPSEVLEKGVSGTRGSKIELDLDDFSDALRLRNMALPQLVSGIEYEAFWTTSWVERESREGPDGGVFQIDRLHAALPVEISPDLLIDRAVLGADYLVNALKDRGKFRYLYSVVDDRSIKGYNLLRHAGTIYALLQVYGRVGEEAHLEAAERAFTYLFNKVREDQRRGPYGGGEVLFVVDNDKVKLGGSALALIAINQYVEATGDQRRYGAQAAKLATFLVAMQKEDGEFISFPGLKAGDPPLDQVSAYYPGEAILALARLYRWDPNPRWLEVAVRGARWLIDVRDAETPMEELAQDHWLMMALRELYELTDEPVFLEHALRIARAVELEYAKNVERSQDAPDYLGGFYNPPRSTPAAIRVEGLTAVQAMCRSAGRDSEWIEEIVGNAVRHQLLMQYTDDLLWWPPNPGRTRGGWAGGLVDPSIRIDAVQHNISALLGYEKVLPGFPAD